jgi:hypothetical protein
MTRIEAVVGCCSVLASVSAYLHVFVLFSILTDVPYVFLCELCLFVPKIFANGCVGTSVWGPGGGIRCLPGSTNIQEVVS